MKKMKRPKLRPYQLEGVKLINKFKGRALLADEMGLGKTPQSLVYGLENDAWPILVVVPSGLRFKWARECYKFTGIKSSVVIGPDYPRTEIKKPKVLIISYNMIGKWMPYLKKLKPQLVIADEIHYAKNPGAARSKQLGEIVSRAPRFLALSGTPATNSPAELWFVLHLLYPKRFPNFMRFARKWCIPRRNRFGGWDFSRVRKKRLPRLRRLLKKICMIRRLKKDVLKDLPPKIRSVVDLEIKRKEYDHAVKDFQSWFVKYSKKNRKTSRNKVHELAKLGYLRRLAAKLKMKGVEEWLDDFLVESTDKVVVFAVHKSVIKRLHERYKDISVVVDGSIVGHKRQIAIDKFNRKKKTRMLIGNIKAAGVGWDASDCATVVFVEMSWTPAEHTQSEDRAHGVGRGKKGVATSIWYLIAKDTIEELLCKINQEKQDNLNLTLDKANDRFDILNLYMKTLEK